MSEDGMVACNKCCLENTKRKILKFSCQHLICHKCSFTNLLSYISKTTQGLTGIINQSTTYPCAKCNKGQSEDLIRDFFSNHVVKRSFTQNLYGKVCDACDTFELKAYCYQCKSYFCKKCLEKIHNSIIPFRVHRITDNFNDFPDKIFCYSCDEDKEIYYMCCEKFLCEICIIRFHLSHSFKFIYNESNNEEFSQYFNYDRLLNFEAESDKSDLQSRIEVEKFEIQINEIHATINKHYQQNKIAFTSLLNDCLKILNILRSKYKSSIIVNESIYADFLFFLDSYNKLRDFLKESHLKFSQDIYTSTVIKTLSKLEKKEDQINSILITEFLNLNIESDEDNDTDSKYNEELMDRIEMDRLKEINNKKKKKMFSKLDTIADQLEQISNISFKHSKSSASSKFNSKSSVKSQSRSLGENLIHNETTKQSIMRTQQKNHEAKYKNIVSVIADPLKLNCSTLYYDSHMSVSTFPNQFTLLTTQEYRDCICWINNLDYSIEIADFDEQGWNFDPKYRARMKIDKVKLKAHSKDIISIKFFKIIDRYCIITCSLDEKCRIFNCEEEFENFLTINCGYKPYSAEMFETFDEESDSPVGFVAICGFTRNSPLKVYNTRTINISEDAFKIIKIEGCSFNLSHKKLTQNKVLFFVSVSSNSKYFFNVYDFETSLMLNAVEVGNYINRFVYRDVVNYDTDKKNLLVVFNDRSGNLYEYDMGLGKFTNKASNLGYYGMDVFEDKFLIMCGKRNSIEIIDIDTFEVLKKYNNAHLMPISNIIVFSHSHFGVGIFTLGEDKYIKLLR